MNSLRPKLPWIGGAAALAVALYVAIHVGYTRPRDAIQAQIDSTRASIAGLDKLLDGEFDLRKRGKRIGATTLAGKQDALEHRFRSGLSRIGEQEGLSAVVVDDASPTDQLNPLLNAKGVPTGMKSALRKAPDFQLVRGSLKGSGTLEQVLKAVAVVEAQPWVHRVEGFSIRPQGPAREKFDLRLDVATVFAPELQGGADSETPQLAGVSREAEPLWRAVVAKNVFKRPSPLASRPVEVAHAPDAGALASAPAPQVFAPYEDWKLTGVMTSGRGTEAFFTNVKTGAKLTVERGGQVLDAVLIEGSGEQVTVEIGGKRFVLLNGQTLAARRPQG